MAGRSPCPGLNALANHGWLPRSGKNIDLAAIQYATVNAFNFGPHVFDTAFQQVQDFKLSTTKNSSTFNLVDLQKHDAIEFDGSLSRNDFYSGDNLNFDPDIWATMVERLRLYQTKTEKFVTVETAAKARAARVKDAMKANPQFNASALQMIGSPGTTALYLTTLWDDSVGAAPKSWIRAFFGRFSIP
jgi:hypothetical protein